MSSRLRPDLSFENQAGYPSAWIVGVDEVGRGCLAGSVVAGAVLLPFPINGIQPLDDPSLSWLKDVRDSKCLRPEARERLEPFIQDWALSWAVGEASVEEIDRMNIYHAAHLAMSRAVEACLEKVVALGPVHVLVDGNRIPKTLVHSATAIVKGDLKCLSIAAASIVAKVYRDRQMRDLNLRFPGYSFAEHKGYSTPVHQQALKKWGPCEAHRKTFAPVAALLAPKSET